MAFEPIVNGPWGRKLSAKLAPALLTLLLATLLAVDFHGIVYRAYLAIILYYLVFVGLCLIAFLICWKKKGGRSTPCLSFLILLVASISFPLSAPLSEMLVSECTSCNRAQAGVKLEYQADNQYEFHVSAHGHGSHEALMLESGFTNITINEDHYTGPSLNYQLHPELVFIENKGCEVIRIPKKGLKSLYESKGMRDIASQPNIQEYIEVLATLSGVRSFNDFEAKLGHMAGARIALVPEENAVYRLCFLMISIEAVLLSLLLTRQPENGEAHKA